MLSLFLIAQQERDVQLNAEKSTVVYFFCGINEGRNAWASMLSGLIYQLLVKFNYMFDHIKGEI